MFDQRNRGKIKNSKILSWRLELSQLSYDITHKPGAENVVPDAFSRVCASTSNATLRELHQSLGHPGFARLYHFVRQQNLPFSSEETKDVCRYCKTCAEVKPRYFKRDFQSLVKAIRPWDRVSVDFKGPVRGPQPYLLIIVDEYSRFPFVFPCKNMHSSTVIDCLSSLFCLFGFPCSIHSDRGASFVSRETLSFLTARGISFSTLSPYHPQGNGQCERINQTIWRTIKLILHGKNLHEGQWEGVLPEALHAVRSLVCLSTNETPHERFFRFPGRAMFGTALPSWLLSPGTVLLRRFVRNKSETLCDIVDLVEANQHYAIVRHEDGSESSVSTSDLALYPRSESDATSETTEGTSSADVTSRTPEMEERLPDEPEELTDAGEKNDVTHGPRDFGGKTSVPLRRSNRERRPPDRFGDWTT